MDSIELLYLITQLINRKNTKSYHAKKQLSVGIRINETTMAIEFINANRDFHCATQDW